MSRSLYIDFNSKKEALVGSSEISTHIWSGVINFYLSCHDFNIKSTSYFRGPSTSDGKFLDDRSIVLAENTGGLRIIKLDEDNQFDTASSYLCRSRMPQVAVWKNSMEVVTSADDKVMIYDAKVAKVCKSYENHHTSYIYSVDTLKQQQHYFLSCGADKKALLWDKRDENIALVLYLHEFCALTSVAWNQFDDNLIVCGTAAGDIYLLDKREPKSFLAVNHCLETNVHRISFNENSNQVAVCGDTQEIVVLDCTQHELKNVYSDSEHQSYVRGLKWSDDILYACAFGKKIYKHEL